MAEATDVTNLRETPLASLHRELGARMVPFAGYAMPVQYPAGILAEHKQVRTAAGLFDVSHMGQAFITGPDHATTAAALESLTPSDFTGLALGRMRYTLLLNDAGGIVDDLMVTRSISPDDDGTLGLVVNADRKAIDYDYLRARLPSGIRLSVADDRALLALQGPQAAAVLARHCAGAFDLAFMAATPATFDGVECNVSRSGYTGEDGFEISVGADNVERVARALLAEPEVMPIGLGARDSLRLEAGLCLYGHDIDEATSPVEADLGFALARRRRAEGGFPGYARIAAELAVAPARLRVGITPEGKAPARDGTPIADLSGRQIGVITSGGGGATIGGPIAMGYVETAFSVPGTKLALSVRGKPMPATVTALPFVPHRYFRKSDSKRGA
ncbi:MAG: glycine cleavage system aminomethyltransferase GcvT [Bauldia sp.]